MVITRRKLFLESETAVDEKLIKDTVKSMVTTYIGIINNDEYDISERMGGDILLELKPAKPVSIILHEVDELDYALSPKKVVPSKIIVKKHSFLDIGVHLVVGKNMIDYVFPPTDIFSAVFALTNMGLIKSIRDRVDDKEAKALLEDTVIGVEKIKKVPARGHISLERDLAEHGAPTLIFENIGDILREVRVYGEESTVMEGTYYEANFVFNVNGKKIIHNVSGIEEDYESPTYLEYIASLKNMVELVSAQDDFRRLHSIVKEYERIVTRACLLIKLF